MPESLDDYPIPSSLEMEQAVIGCALIEESTIDQMRPILRMGDFYSPDHMALWQAICSIRDRGEGVDMYTIQEELRRLKTLTDSNGHHYMIQCQDALSTTAHAIDYARVVREQSDKRQLGQMAQLIHKAVQEEADTNELFSVTQTIVRQISEARPSTEIMNMHDGILATLDEMEEEQNQTEPPGISTPFNGLNYMIGSFKPGDLIVIGARASMGKTALAVSFLLHAGLCGKRSILFSLEMPRSQIYRRMISAVGYVNTARIRAGSMRTEDWERAHNAGQRLAETPIMVDDNGNHSASSIVSTCRDLARKGLDFILIDYLTLIKPDGKYDSRTQEVGACAREIKRLARELNVPVVLLSQLNRNTESRAGNRPQLSDLRDSGEIEQHADIILLLHRANYYRTKDKQEFGEDDMETVDLIVAKNRTGPTGEIELAWHGQYTKFSHLDKRHSEGGVR